MPTLYRRFKGKVFDETTLPMKRKGNHMALSNVGENLTSSGISMRENDYPAFKEEFGHVEGDTIVWIHHKSAVITSVKRLDYYAPSGLPIRPIESFNIQLESTGTQFESSKIAMPISAWLFLQFLIDCFVFAHV